MSTYRRPTRDPLLTISRRSIIPRISLSGIHSMLIRLVLLGRRTVVSRAVSAEDVVLSVGDPVGRLGVDQGLDGTRPPASFLQDLAGRRFLGGLALLQGLRPRWRRAPRSGRRGQVPGGGGSSDVSSSSLWLSVRSGTHLARPSGTSPDAGQVCAFYSYTVAARRARAKKRQSPLAGTRGRRRV